MNPARVYLREGTRAHHDRVDAAFGRFALDAPDDYAAFLLAHAAVLPHAESLVGAARLWSGWRPRSSALLADLRDLGEGPPPSAFTAPPAGEAELWGMLYVLEGSRLGGALLAERVPAGLPKRYLSLRHENGSWKAFTDALEAVSAASDEAWLPRAKAGAAATFNAFETAALAAQKSTAPA